MFLLNLIFPSCLQLFVLAQVLKEYVCRVEGEFPEGKTECSQPVEVVSYKIGVCKVNNLNFEHIPTS